MKIRYLTAGESHGPELTAILEGIPSNFIITKEYIDKFLSRRQKSLGFLYEISKAIKKH